LNLGIREIIKVDAMPARIRKRQIQAARASEFSIEIKTMAYIHHHQKRRASFLGWQAPNIVFCLPLRPLHAVFPTSCAPLVGCGGAIFEIRLQHEAPITFVETALVLAVGNSVNRRKLQSIAQLREKQLGVGLLRASGCLPASDQFGDFEIGLHDEFQLRLRQGTVSKPRVRRARRISSIRFLDARMNRAYTRSAVIGWLLLRKNSTALRTDWV
jgi:hypothetical protein